MTSRATARPTTTEGALHVVHVYDGHEKVFDGRGSVPAVVWNVARETARSGHRVTVIERQWEGLPQSEHREEVDFRRISLRTGATEPWVDVPYKMVERPVDLLRLGIDRTNFGVQALRFLRGLDADVIHVHLPFAANVIATIAPALREKTVFTAHLGELRLDALQERDDVDVPGVLTRFSPDIHLANRVAHTTVLNEAVAELLVDRGVPPDRVTVIPNGVDVERFAAVDPTDVERVRNTYALGDARFLLFVGTVMPRKGVLSLIDALAELEDPAPTLVIAGEDRLDGEYGTAVDERIDALGLRDRVRRVGFVSGEDLPALYSAADALVMPSLEEGFGMTALEAMAAGTPVVGTRVGGLPELITEGETGYLVTAGDPASIAGGIRDLLGADTAQMASAARARAGEYAWSRIVDRFEEVYTTVAPAIEATAPGRPTR